MLLGRELGDERGGDGIVGADEHADEEPGGHELPGLGNEYAQKREQPDRHQIDDEHLLAADGVGEVAPRDGSHEDADEHRRAYGRAPDIGQPESRHDLGERHTDERQHVAVEEGAARREERDLAQKRRHGHIVHGPLRRLAHLAGHISADLLRRSGCRRARHLGHRLHIARHGAPPIPTRRGRSSETAGPPHRPRPPRGSEPRPRPSSTPGCKGACPAAPEK